MSVPTDSLRSLWPFRALPEEALAVLARLCVARSAKAGEVLFREGDQAAVCFALLEGRVDIQHVAPGSALPPKVLGRVAEGSLFGEAAFFQGRTRSADAVVAEPSRLLLIDAVGFRRWSEREPALAVGIVLGLLESTLSRLHQTDQELSLITQLAHALEGDDPFLPRLERAGRVLARGISGVQALRFYQRDLASEEFHFLGCGDGEIDQPPIPSGHPLAGMGGASGQVEVLPLADAPAGSSLICRWPESAVVLIAVPLCASDSVRPERIGMMIAFSEMPAEAVRSRQQLLWTALQMPLASAFSRESRRNEDVYQKRLQQSRHSVNF